MSISVYNGVNVSDSYVHRILDTGVQVYINGVVYTKSVVQNSLQIENVLTRQVDRAKFSIQKYGNYTYTPVVGREVEIYNAQEKVFGGIIIKVTQRSDDYKVIVFDVECEDYTRLLDKKLVSEVFENNTLTEIFSRINSVYLPSDNFDFSNVQSGSRVISYISFNYVPVSQCFQQLADLIQFDWYVDYNKSVHFFSAETTLAPFNLSDDDGSFIFRSLKIRRDNSQMKNMVYVRGGQYLANTFTTEYISDGTQNIYPLAYQYDDIQTSVTGATWTKGIDGVDPIANFDYMWNNKEKFIRFRGDRIPNNTSNIRIAGAPYLPVRVVVRDELAIANTISVEGGDGEHQFLIVDNSINSREGARERATAELESYKNTLSEGEFETYTNGLKAGQTITVNSSAHGINEDFVINKVSAQMWTHNQMKYRVSLVTTKTFGIIEFLQSLLAKTAKEIIINKDEVIDLVYTKSETVSMAETFTASISHNPQTESLSLAEVITEQALNYNVQFVFGPWIPSGAKRVFLLDQSPLGANYTPDIRENLILSESVSAVIT